MRKSWSCILCFGTFVLLWVAFAGCKQRLQPQQFRIGFSQCCDDSWRDVMEAEMYRELAFHPELEEVYRWGVPVILIDRKTESEQYTAYIGADNYEIGATAADYMASQFEGIVKVIELQLGMTMTPAQGRSRGFRDALVEYPGMEALARVEMTAGMDWERAYRPLKTACLTPLCSILPEAQRPFNSHSPF